MSRFKPSRANVTTPWAKIRRAYEIWTEEGDVDTTPSWDRAYSISRRLGKEFGSRTKTSDILTWFDDRKTYSPVVDQVAIDTAVAFLPGSYKILTGLEQMIVREKLALMDNPFDVPLNGMDEVAWRLPTSLRRDRWSALPERIRRHLSTAVPRHRNLIAESGPVVAPMLEEAGIHVS